MINRHENTIHGSANLPVAPLLEYIRHSLYAEGAVRVRYRSFCLAYQFLSYVATRLLKVEFTKQFIFWLNSTKSEIYVMWPISKIYYYYFYGGKTIKYTQ